MPLAIVYAGFQYLYGYSSCYIGSRLYMTLFLRILNFCLFYLSAILSTWVLLSAMSVCLSILRTCNTIQSTSDTVHLITSIYYSHIALANDNHWSTYELTAYAPCPALSVCHGMSTLGYMDKIFHVISGFGCN